MSVGSYRLMRQAAGRGWFAQIQVETVPGDPGVLWSVPLGDPESVHPPGYAAEVTAALAGAAGALAALQAAGVDTTGHTVHIRQLGILATDTEQTAIRAASAAATAAAFDTPATVAFDGTAWHCEIPQAG